jgi:hypothetical protein
MTLEEADKVVSENMQYLDDEAFYGGPSTANVRDLIERLKAVSQAAVTYRSERIRTQNELAVVDQHLTRVCGQLRELGLVD